jgi:hypothetical protein
MTNVAEFMQQNIILQVFGKKGDVDIQADIILAGATTPFGLLTSERRPAIWQIVFVRKALHPRKQRILSIIKFGLRQLRLSLPFFFSLLYFAKMLLDPRLFGTHKFPGLFE